MLLPLIFIVLVAANGVAVEQGVPGHDWTGINSQAK